MIDPTIIDAFSDAIVYGDLSKAKELLAAHPDLVNAQDKYGFSALHNAMSEEQPATIAYLIQQGADVNIQNDMGIAPLHLACYPENAEFLLKAGADINLLTNSGDSPLHILASDGSERSEVIQYLVAQGANKTLKNSSGRTALDIATMRSDRRNIQLLK